MASCWGSGQVVKGLLCAKERKQGSEQLVQEGSQGGDPRALSRRQELTSEGVGTLWVKKECTAARSH